MKIRKNHTMQSLLFFLLAVVLINSALAVKVAYVVKDVRYPNNDVLTLMTGLGYNVDLIDDADIDEVNLSDYDILFVGNERFAYPERIPVNQYNSVVMNSYHVDTWGFANSASSIASNTPLELIARPNNTISPLSGPFTAYTSCCYGNHIAIPAYYLSRYEKSVYIYTAVTTPIQPITYTDSVVGLIANGTVLKNNIISSSRTCYFGITESSYWTEESRELFKECLNYSIYGTDSDGDGYYVEEDCNDSNPNIFPGATELNDSLDQNCMDDAPIIKHFPEIYLNEDSVNNTINLSAIAYDVDNANDELSFILRTPSNNINFTITSNQMLEVTATPDYYGNTTATLIVSDPQGLNTSINFSVFVLPVNDAPVINNPPTSITLSEGQQWNYTLNCTDVDNDKLYYADNTTLFEINNEGVINYTAKKSDISTYTIALSCSDSNLSTTSIFTLTVTPVNHPPVQTATFQNQTINEDNSISYNLADYFSDPDKDNLTFIPHFCSNFSVQINGSTAVVHPADNYYGSSTAYFSATDGRYEVAGNEFIINVLPVNDAPVISAPSEVQVLAGHNNSFDVVVSDIEKDPVEITINNSAYIFNNNKVYCSPDFEAIGKHAIFISATDGRNTTTKIIDINVIPAILINEFTFDPQQDWSGGGAITFNDQWLELYNPGNVAVNLTGWELHYIDFSEEVLHLSGVIEPHKYITYLNQPGSQTVQYGSVELRSNLGVIVDKVTYGNWNDGRLADNAFRYTGAKSTNLSDECIARSPNGYDTDNDTNDFIKQRCTFGISNDADTTPPRVHLIAPADHTSVNSSTTKLWFNATDDSITRCSLYTNLTGSMQVYATKNYSNINTVIDFFNLSSLDDNSIIKWNVLCEDNWSNIGGSATEYIFYVRINDAPVVNISAITLNEDTTYTTDLNNYVFDEENDTLTYSITNQQNADCIINGSQLTITPHPNYFGTGLCSLEVSDGSFSVPFNITLYILSINDAPFFNQSITSWTINENEPFTTILSCVDYDNDVLEYSANTTMFSIGRHTGLINFTPEYYDAGTHSINVSCSDGQFSDTLVIHITIIPINDPPAITPLPAQNLTEDTSYTITVSATDEEGDEFWFSDNTTLFDISSAGVIHFTPTTYDVGEHMVRITATDNHSASSYIDVEFLINKINDAPEFNNLPANFSVQQDTAFTYKVNCTDADALDTITYSDNTSLFNINPETGKISFTPTNNDVGTYMVELSCSDGETTTSQQVEFNIINVNDPPVIIPLDSTSIREDTHYRAVVQAYDPDAGDILRFETNATLFAINSTTGQIDFTPTQKDVGSHTVKITVFDSAGLNDSFTTIFIIYELNDPPKIEPVPTQYLTQNIPYSYKLNVSDEEHDTLSFSDNSTMFNINSSGIISFTPTNNDVGNHTVRIWVTDGVSITYTDIVMIINDVNDAPVYMGMPEIIINEDSTLTIDLNNYFMDPDGDPLSYTFTPLEHVSISQNNNLLTFTPASDWNGNETIRFYATDLYGLNASSGAVRIYVIPQNDAPVIEPIAPIVVTEGELVIVHTNITDIDGDYVIVSFEPPLNSSGMWQTGFSDGGIYTLKVSASDSRGGYTYRNITIMVNEYGNHPPELDPINNITALEGSLIKISPIATDIDGDPLTFIFSPPFNQNGVWQTTYSDAGIYIVTVTVLDSHGGTDSQQVIVNVTESGNHPPTFTIVGNKNIEEGRKLVLTIKASDIDNDELNYYVNNTEFSQYSNLFTWQTTGRDRGIHHVVFTVSDGSVNISKTVRIIVNKKSRNHLFIKQLHVNSCVEAGSTIYVTGIVKNDGTKDLNDVRITAMLPELVIMRKTAAFDLDPNDEKEYQIPIFIPYDVGGIYTLRVVYSNDKIRRVKLRNIFVNNKALGINVC